VHVAPYRFRNKSLLVRAERRFRGAAGARRMSWTLLLVRSPDVGPT
jgi:hypothetical protein